MLTFLPSSCFKKYFSSSFSLLVLNSIGYFLFLFLRHLVPEIFLIYGILSMIWEFVWGLLSYFERLGYSVHLLYDISLIAFPLYLEYHLIFIFIMILFASASVKLLWRFSKCVFLWRNRERSWWLSQPQSLGLPLLW